MSLPRLPHDRDRFDILAKELSLGRPAEAAENARSAFRRAGRFRAKPTAGRRPNAPTAFPGPLRVCGIEVVKRMVFVCPAATSAMGRLSACRRYRFCLDESPTTSIIG